MLVPVQKNSSDADFVLGKQLVKWNLNIMSSNKISNLYL